MATVEGLSEVQAIVEYNFRSINLLALALTAAGADDKVYDGNRKMAQLGESLVELLLADDAFTAGCSRAEVNKKITSATARKHREDVAKTKGISRFIRCNPRQAGNPPSQATLSVAINAIVCACWLDSEKDNTVARKVIWRLGIAIPHEPCLDPRELSIQEQTCLLTNAQTHHSPSYAQSIRSTSDIGNLALTHEWIADDSLDLPDAVETAESYAAEGLDPAEITQKDPLEEAAHWHAYGHGSPSGTEFNSPFRLSYPSPRPQRAQILRRDDQGLSSDSSTPANDEQRIPETQSIWMNENGGTEYSEAGEAGRQMLSDQIQHEYLSLNEDQNPEKTENRSFEATRRRVNLGAASNTRLARNWQGKSNRKSDLDLSRTRPKRNGIMKSNRALVSMTGSRRKKLRNKPLFERETARLESYISQHRKKCEKMGLPCPGDFVYSAETKIRLASLGLESHVNVLRVLSLTIGSCESLVVLKEILRAYRDPGSGSLETTRDVSNAKRLETIRSLSGNAAFFNLLKKCHIHRLFTDNKDSLCDPTDNFIISTTKSVTTRPRGETGNPRNSAEAKITKSIMREVYPEVDSNSADYRLKYREVTELRRTGRRLDMLISRFGLGILGLLPLAQQDSFPGLASRIADSMISHLPDNEFKSILDVLEGEEGNVLREIGNAATQVVEGVFHRTIDSSITFVIEDIDTEQITEYPKGSSELPRLLSLAATSS